MIKDTSGTDVRVDQNGKAASKRKLTLVVSAVLVFAFLVFAFNTLSRWWSSDVSVKTSDIRTLQVQRGEFIRDVSVQGRIVAAIKPSYFSKTSGTISLKVKSGDQVNKGQVLASIESPQLNNQYQQEKAQFDLLSIDVERQRIRTRQAIAENQRNKDLASLKYVAAKRELERSKKAWEKGVISRLDFERAGDERNNAEVEHKYALTNSDLAKDSLEFELQTSELQLEQQRLITEELQRQITELEIKSGVAGIVGDIQIAEQDSVAANQSIMTVIDLSAFEIDANIPEAYADDIAIGMGAVIKYLGEDYAGEVVSISPQVVSGQVKSVVRFEGVQPEGLRQNQRVSIRIVLEDKPDVIKLRKAAYLDSSAGRYVYVISGDTATKRSVSFGRQSVNEVEVISGLEPGEEIISSDISKFKQAEQIYLAD